MVTYKQMRFEYLYLSSCNKIHIRTLHHIILLHHKGNNSVQCKNNTAPTINLQLKTRRQQRIYLTTRTHLHSILFLAPSYCIGGKYVSPPRNIYMPLTFHPNHPPPLISPHPQIPYFLPPSPDDPPGAKTNFRILITPSSRNFRGKFEKRGDLGPFYVGWSTT